MCAQSLVHQDVQIVEEVSAIRGGLRHREAGHVLSSAIAEAACPHQMVCMVVPDPPCVCDGIRDHVIFLAFF